MVILMVIVYGDGDGDSSNRDWSNQEREKAKNLGLGLGLGPGLWSYFRCYSMSRPCAEPTQASLSLQPSSSRKRERGEGMKWDSGCLED